MNKKILALIIIILIAILSITAIKIKQKRAQNREAIKQELVQKFLLVKSQFDEAKLLGLDVSEAEKLGLEAKQAYDKGDYKKAKLFLEKAGFALRNVDKSPSPVSDPTPALVSTSAPDLTPAPTPVVLEKSCASAPAEYKAQCNQLNPWLDEKLAEWKPVEYKPMEFAVYHTLASFPNIRNTDLGLLQNYTTGLEESGADTIIIYMDGTPFLKNDEAIISKWGAVVAKIKSDGKKLYVAYIPDVKGSGLVNWEIYKSVETNTITEIIEKYSPDSIVVLNEPSTIERELSFKPTVDQWSELINDSANLVRSLNSQIRINIQITGGDLSYFNSFIKVKNIDGVGFNIYGFRAFDAFTPYVALVKNAGKTPILSETWKMFKDNQKYDGMDSLDAKWVRAAVYYAQANGMSYANPFFTFYFFVSAADVRNQSAFLDKLKINIANGNRTKSFNEYKSVTEEVRNNIK